VGDEPVRLNPQDSDPILADDSALLPALKWDKEHLLHQRVEAVLVADHGRLQYFNLRGTWPDGLQDLHGLRLAEGYPSSSSIIPLLVGILNAP